MDENGMDYFMAIFGFHRLKSYFKPCEVCIVGKGFIECDKESYEWV